MSLSTSIREVDGVTIVDLSGRITLGEASEKLRDTVREIVSNRQTKILLKLGDVGYIDSPGLVSWYRATPRPTKGSTVKLVNVQEKVNDLLQITKLYPSSTSFRTKPTPSSASRSNAAGHTLQQQSPRRMPGFFCLPVRRPRRRCKPRSLNPNSEPRASARADPPRSERLSPAGNRAVTVRERSGTNPGTPQTLLDQRQRQSPAPLRSPPKKPSLKRK